jgi:phosphohistidine phosphatase
MDLYICRHGIAAELGEDGITRDADRPLTAEGKRKLNQIGKALNLLEIEVELVVSSPYVRAIETAEILYDSLHVQRAMEVTEELIPNGNVRQFLALMRKLNPKSVLVVGHEPYLSSLIALLVSGNPDAAILMKKASICKLVVNRLEFGRCACLEWLLTPKQMGLMR